LLSTLVGGCATTTDPRRLAVPTGASSFNLSEEYRLLLPVSSRGRVIYFLERSRYAPHLQDAAGIYYLSSQPVGAFVQISSGQDFETVQTLRLRGGIYLPNEQEKEARLWIFKDVQRALGSRGKADLPPLPTSTGDIAPASFVGAVVGNAVVEGIMYAGDGEITFPDSKPLGERRLRSLLIRSSD